MSQIPRSPETDAMIRSIQSRECGEVIGGVVARAQEAPLLAIREFLNGEIAKLGIDADPEAILTLRNRLEYFSAMVKELRDRLDEDVFIPWLSHNGDLEAGDIRYFAGVAKTTKPAIPLREARRTGKAGAKRLKMRPLRRR